MVPLNGEMFCLQNYGSNGQLGAGYHFFLLKIWDYPGPTCDFLNFLFLRTLPKISYMMIGNRNERKCMTQFYDTVV